MRGVYCNGSSIQLNRNLSDPEPLVGEVRIQVRAVGICDTDIQLARGYMAFEESWATSSSASTKPVGE
jgi:D-arabinose 1-dehydrogenase-like Zn-dependent alcohol dehydrogenase